MIVIMVLTTSIAQAGCFTHPTIECAVEQTREMDEHFQKMEALQQQLDMQAKINDQQREIQQMKRDMQDYDAYKDMPYSKY